jgi:phosphoribosylformylglycinamidine cyclo-ligase
MTDNAYELAGVNIDAANRAKTLMTAAVQATYGKEVLSGIGAFGGLFDASALKGMQSPVLVASTDGVGTKTKVAARLKRWDTIGQDLVNHSVNDILVQGARPLFFLDYVASSQVQPEQIALVVAGVAAACQAVGCALLGGETAEMPGVYLPGEIDLAGTMIGVVERSQIIDGSSIQAGDVIVGFPSSGLHTNGYSLARRVLDGLDWSTPIAELGSSIGDALLTVHRSYIPTVAALKAAGVVIKGLAHITGGGLIENPPRIFPAGLGALIKRGSWDELPIFRLIQAQGHISAAEMFRVFNMGLGMIAVISREHTSLVPPEYPLVGEMVSGSGVTII